MVNIRFRHAHFESWGKLWSMFKRTMTLEVLFVVLRRTYFRIHEIVEIQSMQSQRICKFCVVCANQR